MKANNFLLGYNEARKNMPALDCMSSCVSTDSRNSSRVAQGNTIRINLFHTDIIKTVVSHCDEIISTSIAVKTVKIGRHIKPTLAFTVVQNKSERDTYTKLRNEQIKRQKHVNVGYMQFLLISLPKKGQQCNR
jgi:hypothetical protein